MKAVGQSDIGRVRTNNEDAFGIWDRHGLFVVADGMGGHEAGEVASQQAVEVIHRELTTLDEDGSPRQQLRQAVEVANREIFRAARDHGNNMGTTATVVWVVGDRAHIAQVGDSRAYLWRERQLTQLTDDHSMVSELVNAGVLTREGAEAHPARNVLTRALGQEDSVEVDVVSRVTKPGDVLLLCSDGLTTMVSDDEIRSVLSDHRSPGEAVGELIRRANDHGGADNITVVLATRPGRSASSKPKRRGFSLLPLVPVAAVAGVALVGYLFLANTFFLGPDGDEVAVFRGFPVAVGEHRLATVIGNTGVRMDALGQPYADRIRRGMLVASPSAGKVLLQQIAQGPQVPDQSRAADQPRAADET